MIQIIPEQERIIDRYYELKRTEMQKGLERDTLLGSANGLLLTLIHSSVVRERESAVRQVAP
ncbi:MAG: hypothetical protein ACRDF4_01815 [Rhabdochlamydiaceae bacterium]